ncbi:glycosyltransferase family 1 protein [Clostridium sp. CTA-7]
MRIGIDARPLIEKKTGIGYYLKYLLENILDNDKENEYVLFSDRKIFFDIEKYENVSFIIDEKSVLKKTFWYMFKLNKLCNENKIDIFWGTQHVLPLGLKNQKCVLTVHDLVAFDFKKTMNIYNRIINRLLIPRSILKADKIIAVSKSTKNRLEAHFNRQSNNKVKVIYEDVIVKRNYHLIKDNYLRSNGLEEKRYILFLGTIEPRKNIITLINSLEYIYNSTKMKLVICGKYGWNCEKEKELIDKNKDKIIFLNYISDDEKDYLMNKSFAFIFPSLYEGFGLPVLEAMRNNTVTIVSDNTSLSEIVDNSLIKFDTLNEKDLASKVIELYNDPNLYKEALKYCNDREKYFNWNDISREYIFELSNWEE